jgi:hypothetical protein
MSSRHPGPPLTLPFLLSQAGLLPEALYRDISHFLKSAEFRVIDDLIQQILFCREEAHKFSWEILSSLFKKPGSALRDWVKQDSKDQESKSNPESARLQFAGPNSSLMLLEESTVFRWILDQQLSRNCVTPRKIRDFAAD